MATLKIENEEVRVSDALVIRMAERMWKLGTDARRAAYAERARKRLNAGGRGKNDVAVAIVADHRA
ncbi:MAG TPA: hypothetical protein VN823_23510 [Stellaceae bacterium]|nr:hypothetical protein [Stellaceae bacterium]